MNLQKKDWTNPFTSANISFVRGISAVGSAPHWQCGGHGFKSRMLHFLTPESISGVIFLPEIPILNCKKGPAASFTLTAGPLLKCRAAFLLLCFIQSSELFQFVPDRQMLGTVFLAPSAADALAGKAVS